MAGLILFITNDLLVAGRVVYGLFHLPVILILSIECQFECGMIINMLLNLPISLCPLAVHKLSGFDTIALRQVQVLKTLLSYTYIYGTILGFSTTLNQQPLPNAA